MDASPSSSGSSTAISASPGRIQRPSRQGSESIPLLAASPTTPSHTQPRTASRSKWLLVQTCFLFLVLAGVVLFSMDARRTAWITGLVQRSGSEAPAPAFQGAQTPAGQLKLAKVAGRQPGQDAQDALAFVRGAHELDWRPEEYGARVGGGIPKILHHIFLDGEAEYAKAVEAAKAVGSGFKREWRDSCTGNHSDWKHMFWDKAAALAFLGAHYPWFISTFLSYPKVVLQGDALRPFLLHAYGGMYLDLDVQCFTSSEAWLAPYTLVLQSEYGDGRDIVNSVMASVPGHPFWKAIIGQMMQKIGVASGDSVNSDIILESTGPRLYSGTFYSFVPEERRQLPYPGELQVGPSRIRVYGLGEWFVPCEWNNKTCHQEVAVEVHQGRVPEKLAGHHQYSGSWLSTVPFGHR